jgi:glyoxylate reductase
LKPKVLVFQGFHEEAVNLIKEVADVRFYTGRNIQEMMAELVDAEGIVANRVTEELLAKAPRLKVVAVYGVGYDGVDVAAATSHQVYVTHTPGVLSNAVADLTMLLILSLARGLLYADRYTRTGWGKDPKGYPPLGCDLAGKTLGLVGLGRIGYEVARRAKSFGMRIIYYDVVSSTAAEKDFGAERTSLENLMRGSDFVSIHCPLTEKTKGLIGDREISMMKSTAYLINTARGPIVDQKALTKALQERKIAGAGLDVFEVEPVPLDEPILKLDNVVLTPHAGSLTVEARRGMALMDAKNIVQVLKGQIPPENVVPEQKGLVFRRG